jgi:hypothetical protein
MYSNRFDIGQLRVTYDSSVGTGVPANTITTNTSGINIVLSTVANTGTVIKPEVEIQAPLKLVIDSNYDTLSANAGPPAVTAGSIKFYAKNEGAGGTGIFFVNSQSTRDELPSKRRAFVASLVL